MKLIYYGGSASGSPWGALCVNGYQRDSIYYQNSTRTTVVGAHYAVANPQLPSTVTAINAYAFEGCENIASLTLPAGVTSIGNGAFKDCPALATLNYTATNCNQMTDAFGGSTHIAELNVGGNVQKIPAQAFQNCTGIKRVDLPISLTQIGANAFAGCDSIAQTHYAGSAVQWCGIQFGNEEANPISISHNLYINNGEVTSLDLGSVSTIGNYAFYGCSSLVGTLNIPQSVTSIGNMAFGNCTGLTSINYAARSCTSANQPFGGCTSITSISISDSVARIPNNLFANGLNGVTEINVACANPPYAYGNSFSSIPSYVPVNVPCGSMMQYYATSWSYFNNIVDECETVSITANANNAEMGMVNGGGAYSVGDTATLTAIPYANYIFRHWADGNVANPLKVAASTNQTYTAIFGPAPAFDTIQVVDTVPVFDTTIVAVYDTISINDTVTVFDTVDVPIYVHDTTYIPVHDTSYITLTDTVTNTLHDTVYNTVYDTVTNTLHDTVYSTVYDTVTNTLHDTVYSTVYDTVTNTLYDTVYSTVTDTLWLTDTVYIHDTVYVTTEGIDDPVAADVKFYQRAGRLVVEGAEGENVMLFDAVGRQLAARRDEYGTLEFDVPASGAYLVKVGNAPARRVVVVR